MADDDSTIPSGQGPASPAGLPLLRVFVSSPGDVAEERLIAKRILDRLAAEFAAAARIKPVFWEHEPLLASGSFQEQIPLPSQTDIVVCILWARIGTRLPRSFTNPDGTPRYKTGTEFEFEDALEGRKQHGAPDLLVYRKTAEPLVSLKDPEATIRAAQQKMLLDRFVEGYFHGEGGTLVAAFHPFDNAADFETRLEEHLRKLIAGRLQKLGVDAARAEEAARPTWTKGSPFRGLAVFDFQHHDIFFGRTRAIGDVIERLKRQAADGRAFLLVLGVSGCGKSSLVRAGVLPMLVQPAVVEGVGLWRRAVLRPAERKGDLFDGLAAALLAEEALPELASDGTTADKLAALLRANPAGAPLLLRGYLSKAAGALPKAKDSPLVPTARLVLVLDQLEELFTAADVSPQERVCFFEAVRALAESGQTWVIATLRNDFYDRCAAVSALMQLKSGGGQYDLAPPDVAEIGQLVRRPAAVAGLRFEEDMERGQRLDDLLRDATAANPHSLPLLEFTLDELYRRRSGSVLTLGAYRELGGVEGALAQRAQDAFDALSPPARAALPRVFRELVTVGEGEADRPTRKQAALDGFGAADGSSPSRELVDKFVAERLLTAKGALEPETQARGVGTDSQRANAVVEIAHEALLSHWQPLVQWLGHDRELLRVRGRIAAAAARWDQEGRRTDRLLQTGKPLDEANQLVEAGFDLNPLERGFVAASRAQARRRRNARRLAIAALVVLAASASLAAVVANRMRHDADEAKAAMAVQKTAAESARQVADQQRQEADHQRQIAQSQTVAAEQQRQNAEQQRGLAESRQREADQQRQAAESALIPLAAREWEANDGGRARQLLDKYPAARRQWEWNYVNRLFHGERTMLPHPACVFSVAFSPRADKLVSTSGPLYENGGDVRVWETQTGRLVCTFKGHRGSPRQAVFLAGGKRVISASQDEVFLWNAQDGSVIKQLSLGPFRPEAITFSKDGSLVAAAENLPSNVSHVHIYRIPEGTEVRTIDIRPPKPAPGHPRSGSTASDSSDQPSHPVYIDVTAMAFSLDGRRLATVHNQRSVKLWDLAAGTELRELSEGDTIILDAALSDDGTQLACGRIDGTTPVWDTETGRRLFILGGHNGAVSHVVFCGGRIATSSWDQSAKVWDAHTGVESFTIRGHANWVTGVAISRSGGSIATSSWDGTAKIWDGSGDGVIPKQIDGSLTWIEGLAFLPNGRSIADARIDQTVWVWSINGRFPEATFKGERFVAFNDDGSLIATRGTGDDGKLLRIFNVHGDADNPRIVCRGHTLNVMSAAFRPHSTQIASAGADGAVKVWDAEGKELFTCRGHNGSVAHVVYSADGRWIVSGGFDKTLRVWDADSGKPVRVFQGHPGPVTNVAVSTNKRMVAAAGGEFNQPGQATVWDADSGKVLWELKGYSNEVSCVLFSLNGKRIFTGSYDKSVKIWDTETGQEALTLRGHAREVTALALSRDGNLLASAGRDGMVRVWDGTPAPPSHEP